MVFKNSIIVRVIKYQIRTPWCQNLTPQRQQQKKNCRPHTNDTTFDNFMSLTDDEDELQDATNNMTMLMLLFVGKILKEGKTVDPRQLLPLETRRIISGTIRRKSLQDPTASTFWKLYNANQDESLIQLVGFHKKAFDELVELFRPVYEQYTPHSKFLRQVKRRAGRTRLLCAKSCLGLVLTWL